MSSICLLRLTDQYYFVEFFSTLVCSIHNLWCVWVYLSVMSPCTEPPLGAEHCGLALTSAEW